MNLNNNEKDGMNFFRKIFFPIHWNEIPKFILIVLILASALFCFTSLRILKDSLISNAPGASSETFNVLKFIGLGTAILLTVAFSSFTKNKSSAETFIYAFTSYIIIYFVLAIIAPYAPYLQASPEVIQDRIAHYPSLRYPIAVHGNWIYSMIYLFVEYCGNFLITFIFWQAVNSLTADNDRRRIYPFYGHWGNLKGMIGAAYISSVENFCFGNLLMSFIGDQKTVMQVRYRLLIASASLVMGLICYLIVIFFLLNEKDKIAIFQRPSIVVEKSKDTAKNIKATKEVNGFFYYILSPIGSIYSRIDASIFWPILIPLKPFIRIGSSISENLNEISKSPFLISAGICVLGYGISVNLIESIWKRYIRDMHVGFDASAGYYEGTYLRMALASALCGLIGGQISARLSWFWLGIFTPIAMFSSGLVFFVAVIADIWNIQSLNTVLTNLAIYAGYSSNRELILFIGQIQNIFSKSLKYILFDSAMQMLYPYVEKIEKLDPKKAKAMLDASFGRLGKSGSSTIQSLLFILIAGDVYDILPITLMIFISICIIWIMSVFRISRLRASHETV